MLAPTLRPGQGERASLVGRGLSSAAYQGVLLAAFVAIETRNRYALLPMRLLRSRDRSGAFLTSLCTGTALQAKPGPGITSTG